MTRRVVGIDLSLTSTGVAVIVQRTNGSCFLLTTLIKSSGKRADDLRTRHRRLSTLGADILHVAAASDLTLLGEPKVEDQPEAEEVGPDLVVVEGPTMGLKSASPVDRHALYWYVTGGLIRRDVPVAWCPPTSLKAAIAGKGSADKAAMAGAVAKLWPSVDIESSDVSDAVGLAHLAAVRLGWDVETRAEHDKVKVDWPEFGAAA